MTHPEQTPARREQHPKHNPCPDDDDRLRPFLARKTIDGTTERGGPEQSRLRDPRGLGRFPIKPSTSSSSSPSSPMSSLSSPPPPPPRARRVIESDNQQPDKHVQNSDELERELSTAVASAESMLTRLEHLVKDVEQEVQTLLNTSDSGRLMIANNFLRGLQELLGVMPDGRFTHAPEKNMGVVEDLQAWVKEAEGWVTRWDETKTRSGGSRIPVKRS